MKNLINCLLELVLVLSLTACGGKKDEKPASTWANDKPKSQIGDGWKRPGEGDQLTLPLEEESPFGK